MRRDVPVRLWLAFVLSVSLLIRLLFLARNSGNWIENDTMVMTISTKAVLGEATVNPQSYSYPFGFGYQVVVAVTQMLTGLDLSTLQLLVFPLAGMWLLLVIYAFVRAVCDDDRALVLATGMMLIQPDTLFTSMRGSHEKDTLLFLGTILLLIVLQLDKSRRIRSLPARVALILLSWGLICTSSFFSTIILLGLILAYEVGRSIQTRLKAEGSFEAIQSGWMVLWGFSTILFLVFVYSPSITYFRAIQRYFLDAQQLLTGASHAVSSPYTSIGTSWLSPWVWGLLALPVFSILLASAAAWVFYAAYFVRRRDSDPRLMLCWCGVLAFGAAIFGGVLADRVGSLGVTNIQLRLIPIFLVVASPLVGVLLANLTRAVSTRQVATLAVSGLIVFGIPAAYLKGTDHPAVSNIWIEYTPQEYLGLKWLHDHSPGGRLWIDFDTRLALAEIFAFEYGGVRHFAYAYADDPGPFDIVFTSQEVQERAFRLGIPMPDTWMADHVYASGGSDLYVFALRPEPVYAPPA
jgi:hypothetical protein